MSAVIRAQAVPAVDGAFQMGERRIGAGVSRMTRWLLLGLCLSLAGVGLGVPFGFNRLMGEDSSMSGTEPAPAAHKSATGRLRARPQPVRTSGPAELRPLKLGARRDGYIYVPAGAGSERPAPLLLMLHGAGGNARQALSLLQNFADETGLILLAPDSREQTWDLIVGGYGPDVDFIDRVMEQTFARYNVDPTRVAIGGFSDGASFALSLGATNGDLFTHIVALSPGFMAPASQHGSPALFISHGTRDGVLPIEACSRKIVPRVKRAGYRVTYREFDGPHIVPPDIAGAAVEWFLNNGRTE
jgi:phospholipase/carboxylesterase